MARLTRKDMKVFAGNATNNSVFGSLQAGTPTITNDVEQIQSLAAWENGWNDATMTSEKLPPLEDLQTVSYVTTYQQAYLMQEGLPEWSATVIYFKGCLAKEVTLTGFKIYNSLTDNNTGNALSDTSNWKLVMDSDDLYALDSTVVHTADLGASSTIVGSDFPVENQNKVLWSATTGKVGTYPYFDANKLQYLNTITSDVQTQLNAKAADNAVVKLSGSQTVTGTKTFSSSPLVLTPSSSDNSQKSANTAWVRTFVSGQVSSINTRIANRSSFSPGNRVTLSASIDHAFSIPSDGILILTIEVGGQTNSTVYVRMANSGTAVATSAAICRFLHNGGGSERNDMPLTIPVKSGQSIYLDWNGTGNASVIYAYLFPFAS